ncbi:F420-dependent NADP oxidoreductase, partial [Streptomyces xanthophaeus]
APPPRRGLGGVVGGRPGGAPPGAAAGRAELLVLMLPFDSVRGLLPQEAVRHTLLVDATHACSGPGAPRDLGTRGSSELVADWYPGARLVKSLNTMHFETLAVAGTAPERQGSERLA